ncbi:MAG TPA: HlyD family secretion protein [Allosphingosinicella sp.]|uniref:HlyD family secretion protein n=1 Tax=Allosphingosinicella sp. TaxID=2823234 RepID=UPI002ED9AB7B
MAELALISRNDEPQARKKAPAGDAGIAADAPPAPGRKKKRILGILGAALLLGGAGFGYQYTTVWAHQETTDNAYVRADITPVAAKVEGYVAKLMVTDNQRVQAGDVLMIIDAADYEAKVARAEADLAAARANLRTLAAARQSASAQVGAQGGAINQASAQLAAMRASAARALADESRFAELARRGWTTKARLDQVRAEARSAQAQVAAAEAAVTAQRGQSGALVANTAGAAANIAAGEAQVQAAEAALRQAKIDLERTVIRAPVSGVVGNRGVREGQLVKSGQQLLAVVPVEQAYVVANFKETQLEKMQVGQPVDIALDAYPGLTVRGRIESLAPASGAQFALIPTDSATGNFTKIVQRVPVKIVVEKGALGSQLLRPGLSVEATVNTKD